MFSKSKIVNFPKPPDTIGIARRIVASVREVNEGVAELADALLADSTMKLAMAEAVRPDSPCRETPCQGDTGFGDTDLPNVAESTGPIRRLLDLRAKRREIIAELRRNGIDGEHVVGKLGDGTLLELLVKYGPTIYAIARAIAAMFGVILPPLPADGSGEAVDAQKGE